jgi:O-antigen ligase
MQRLAFIALLILPVCLLHARAGAEICIGVVDVLFVAHLALTKGWRFLNRPWIIIAAAWWFWEIFCSLPIPGFGVAGWAGLVQALVFGRLLLLAAAMEIWLLTTPATRRAAWILLALSVLWIGLESWQQYLIGSNIFGDHRWPDGSLTGPFWEPRAGAPYAHMLLAALLPVVVPLLARKNTVPRVFAVILAVFGIATSILIGQRMPSLLMLFALAVSCLFIPRIRLAAAIAVVIGAAVLAATPIISPPTYAKLVLHFAYQMRTFPISPYGELYTRAATMGLASPWHGFGFNGFKTLCMLPAYEGGFPALGIAPTTLVQGACNQHPHNFYMQAFTDGGFPGLALFAALNLSWLLALARGLWRRPDPMRVGLFAGVLTYAWPFASTDSFATLPHAGWLVFMVGLGLAAAHIGANPTSSDTSHV